MDTITLFARDLAQRMGALALDRLGALADIRTKADDSLVTEVDLAAEAMAVEAIGEAFPQHGVLGEEGGITGGSGPYTWVIDPIDGTTNYTRGLPLFAVSLAVFHERQPVAAAIHVPVLGETYWAGRGSGAFCNGRRLACPHDALTSESTFAVGSLYDKDLLPPFLTRIIQQLKMRNTGSAVLNFVWVADGRLAGAVSEFVKLWDIAAAALICQEAGALVTQPNGAPRFPLALPVQEYGTPGTRTPLLIVGPGALEEVRSRFFHDYVAPE